MTEPEATPVADSSTGPSALQRARTIAGISALFALAVGVLVLVVMLVSLYPSLRATVQNLERISEAMAVSAETLAGSSDEAVLNLVETSANLSAASANLTEATANLERNSVDDRMAESIIRLLEQRQQFNNR